MKWWICLTALVLALTTSAAAADLPAELERAAPEAAEDLTGGDLSGGTGFAQGVGNILDRLADQVGDVVRERTRGAAAVLLVVVLCGVVEGFAQGTGGKGAAFLPMAGALSITLASAGSLDSLMGLGSRTIGELADFSQALLPTLAAATAASGAVTTATVQQVSTVFFVDLLLRLIRQLLLPLVYLYIGLLTAAACLPENRLGAIAEALKKLVTWILTTALLVFTIYLSIVRIISGSADSATVKVAKAAISGVVPVVGGIIADASETVLAGAGMLKNTIGVFGMLAILAACAYPPAAGGPVPAVQADGVSGLRGGGAGAVQAHRRAGRRLRPDSGHDRRLRAAAAHLRAGLRGGGDAMMEAVRAWLTSVVLVSVLLSAAQSLIPPGTVRKAAGFTGGLILLLVLLRPVLGADLEHLELDFDHYQAAVEERQEELADTQTEAMASIIAEQTEAYILDKAGELGLEVTVRVETRTEGNGIPVPWSAELTGSWSQALASALETELGIPAERQVWHEREAEN